MTAPYLSELANRVIDAARGYGYSVYVTTYAEGSAQGAQSLLRNFNTTVSDGMILSISEVENLEAADLDVDYPLVCVGARSTHGKATMLPPTIFRKPDSQPNTCSTMAQPGSRWSDREPNRSISIPCVKQWKAMRNCDFAACSKRAPRGSGIRFPTGNEHGQDWTIGSGARITQQLIDSGIPFDGIVAFNDQLALGALFTLAANGISVPEQMQVIGFDNIEEAAYSSLR